MTCMNLDLKYVQAEARLNIPRLSADLSIPAKPVAPAIGLHVQ